MKIFIVQSASHKTYEQLKEEKEKTLKELDKSQYFNSIDYEVIGSPIEDSTDGDFIISKIQQLTDTMQQSDTICFTGHWYNNRICKILYEIAILSSKAVAIINERNVK